MNYPQPDCLTWNRYYRNIYIKISLHAIGRDHTPENKGIWCYYIFIHESRIPSELFKRLWLEDERIKLTDVSPWRITHDYYTDDINALDFHGGCTYYAKHGHTDGHRSVEIGCDYNHLWDMEQGFEDFDKVLSDAQNSVDKLLDILCKV